MNNISYSHSMIDEISTEIKDNSVSNQDKVLFESMLDQAPDTDKYNLSRLTIVEQLDQDKKQLDLQIENSYKNGNIENLALLRKAMMVNDIDVKVASKVTAKVVQGINQLVSTQ